MVYVLDIEGRPLMPTERHGKVRRLLRDGQAHVVRLQPFTIQLDYESTTYRQKVSLGVDAGSVHIGVSATTEMNELFAAEVVLRTDIVKRIASRLELRRGRRFRKTRYRKPRFDNRRRKEDWLAPSVRNKVEKHKTADAHDGMSADRHPATAPRQTAACRAHHNTRHRNHHHATTERHETGRSKDKVTRRQMNIGQIKAAIRKAVDVWKAKTWFNFYGIEYEDMYEFLSDKYVTIPKAEYDHLLKCKADLMQLYETQIQSMRTDIVQSAMVNTVTQQLLDSMGETMNPQPFGGVKFRDP